MKATLNSRIKNREPFRPFAPVILRERVNECFRGEHEVPFMIAVYRVRPEWRERQERDVEGADWLAQQPGYGDTPPWTNVPSRPRDPEAYEMLAPGQQKQEDRLSAAEEAVRMDQLRKKPIELLER